MTRKPLALAFALLALGLPVAGRTDSAPARPADETAMKKTIVDIRNVGTAMYSWYKDEMAPKRSPRTDEEPLRFAHVDSSARTTASGNSSLLNTDCTSSLSSSASINFTSRDATFGSSMDVRWPGM